MSVCYIVGAGEFPYPFTKSEGDLVIAADGGFDALLRYGISCDLLIGDLDSIERVPDGVEILRHPVKKDETDMHLAYLEARRRGYSDVRIYGGTGGREDHTFANLSLLLYIKNDGAEGTLYGRNNLFTVIKNEEKRYTGRKGKHFSAFAFGTEAHGVTIRGLEYECEGITLTPDFPLATSNVFTDREAVVSVADGALLIITEI